MQVILLEDVAQVGQKYDIKDVPRGHALNFLIPRRLAEPATKTNRKRIERMKAQKAESEEAVAQAFSEALERLANQPVTITAPANESGHLYEKVSARDIAAQLKEKGIDVPENAILLDEPIKEVGEHTVSVKHGEQEGTVTFKVEAAE